MSISGAEQPDCRLFLPSEMKAADLRADSLGIGEAELVRGAARAIAQEAMSGTEPGVLRIAVLAGPGLNGADGRVAARILAESGFDVTVFDPSNPDDAEGFTPERFGLVVDALFGAGLTRSIEGVSAHMIERLNRSKTEVLSVDLPSGVDGRTGESLGIAVNADRTVTFEARKPGHLLLPGRRHCGRVTVARIGLPPAALDASHGSLFANEPALWRHLLLGPRDIGHKYDRGHAAVFSGPAHQTGAARMSAGAALRGGAGLVTVLSPPSAILVNASHLTAIMLKRCADGAELASILEDGRLNVFVLGPGFGIGETARDYATRVLDADRRLILDADGITSFKDYPDELFKRARAADGSPRLVMTPHEGEFERLFPDLGAADGVSKIDRAKEAARRSGAVVVLKGSDTVIAEPGGRAAVNACASPWLATAGTGDVLAGLIASQLANGLPTFEAAAAGVWIHGRAAQLHGPGLIAEDLPGLVPRVLAELLGG